MGMLVAQGSMPIGVGTNRLPPPVPVRTGFWPSLALPRSTPSLTWPRYGRSQGSRTWRCPYPDGIRPLADECESRRSIATDHSTVRQNLALNGLFLRRVRNDDAGGSFFLDLDPFHQNAVVQRSELLHA